MKIKLPDADDDGMGGWEYVKFAKVDKEERRNSFVGAAAANNCLCLSFTLCAECEEEKGYD